ncbi:hypothetical protein JRO89_XS15G0163600 [Xanthoceras sorbifolium]|uniref:Uncharacterized protein n=1 Tax=Xanthoceras sorbifolium TaxID=99658 RepID=A0ABQ8H2L3_9ROSI|nr:hypothetical protein JRO89_XS15G0163600 [Xanthoceras sorbifolium]
MEFRPRNYTAEQESHALPRSRADHHHHHPLFTAPPSLNQLQVDGVGDSENNDFIDPLRAPDTNSTVSVEDIQYGESSSTVSSEAAALVPVKEWTSFKRFIMQKFPVSKMVSVSSMSDVIIRTGKAHVKSSTSMHLEELDDPEKFAEEGVKVVTGQEYVSRLHELKDEIKRAWCAEDRVTALKLSIKVAKLLMDTSVLQFYPTLFVLATEVLDMLGDMVWERIKLRAELAEDGTKLCFLPENFIASNICVDAKETCNNWFCKVGSIRELLPRIYLELALLPCWRFLLDRPADSLQRLVQMTRGLADPLASTYCRLFMAHCARKLPSCDTGHLITSVNDIKVLLMRILSTKETMDGKLMGGRKLLVSLMEPTIEYIMKCIFKDASQRQVGNVIVELGLGRNQVELFGSKPCVSIVLHHLLKELPTEVVSTNAVDILHLIECSSDNSFDQCLNYRLLGFRLCERKPQMDIVDAVIDRIIQVVMLFDKLDDYLKVVDAFLDIVLQNQMDNHLKTILEGISERACNKEIFEDEVVGLQSILMKLLSHFKDLDDLFALSHFLEIFDVIYGSSRNIIDMQILNMASRNGNIHDQTTIKLLFEICQSLHDGIDVANMKDDNYQQPARLICRFVHMVDYGAELERHLTFLVECRGAFGSINELKETLVHSSNCLATKALRDGQKHISFAKSCIAFSEVTIPSISAHVTQLNLYIETAEVALLAGLVSHSDGLIDSALGCLQSVELINGSQTQIDVDGIVSSIRKLCSLLVMVPGNPELGVTYTLKSILSLINSQLWMTSRIKIRMLCAIVSLSATLAQSKLPYHADLELSNDVLFYRDSSYVQELVTLSEQVLQNLLETIEREPSRAARGSMALEACNCLASSFEINRDILPVYSKLIETAKSSLSSKDKYLQSTIKFLDKHLSTSEARAATAFC